MQERNVWSHGSNLVEGKKTYITALLFGLPNVQIAKLQRVQNAAARLILGIGKFSHITPALYELHWLPVSLRIDYKILLLTFKCIYGLAPTYLSDLISILEIRKSQDLAKDLRGTASKAEKKICLSKIVS